MEEKLEQLKILLGISDATEDALLQTLLLIAERAIINRLYPFKTIGVVIPNEYILRQIEIAVYLYNRRGSEGQTSHNENGINRSYESAYIPDSMLKDIIPYVEVVK